MDNILQNLNDSQREAVTTTEGYVRVIAGAGSGKTKALTSRYIYLVKELGISTSNILCVTFTNKAAREMQKRIRKVIGDNDTGMVCTFHGLCRQILKEEINAINYPNNFMIMDMDDVDSVLKVVYEQGGISSRTYNFSKAKEIIRYKKRHTPYIQYILEMNSNNIKEKFLNADNVEEQIFFGYLYQQRKSFNLDFDDLILFTLYILENYKERREKWQKKIQYIMVDEFQDVSANQYAIASILSEYHKNLFVVGDPDQTIYSWRGARIDYILNFDKQFHDTKTIMMNTNYRSTENILNASNSLIAKNQNRIKKKLTAVKKSDIPVVYNHAENIYDEAAWIAAQIDEIVASGKKYSDVCILYRAHYVSRSIEENFIRNKIPYALYSGVEFYQRKEIKDVLSYLRMIVFEDDLSFRRVINEPKRNFGKKRMEILETYAEERNCSLFNALRMNIDKDLIKKSKASEFMEIIENYQKAYKEMSISDLVTDVLNDSGYKAMLRQSGENERLDNLAELKDSIVSYESSAGEETLLEDYLQEISLYTNHDLKEKKDRVKMMTIHTAKGLEFPYVFVTSLNEGIFPSKRADTREKLEEERRLAYVAYTRAENALFLSEAKGRNYDGSMRYPSRFIFNTDNAYLKYCVELEEELVEESNAFIESDEGRLARKNNYTFNKGDYVEHEVFGIGVIEDIDYDNYCYSVNFKEYSTNRNLSFSANLKMVSKSDNSNIKGEKKSEVKKDTIISEIKAEYEKKESLSKEEVERLKEFKLKFISNNDKLKEEKNALEAEVSKLKESELKLESNNSKLNEEKLKLEEELKKHKEILKENEVKRDTVIQEIKVQFAKKEKLYQEIEKLKDSRLKFESMNSTLEEELEKLREFKSKLELENDKLKEEKKTLEDEVSKLKEAQLKLESNNSKINEKLYEKENEIERLNLQLEIKEQEKIILECKLAFFGEKAKRRRKAEEKINKLRERL